MTEHESETPQAFMPDPALAAKLAMNRAGKLTKGQRTAVTIASAVSVGGLLFIALVVFTVVQAWQAGIRFGGVVSLLFFIFFMLSFGYIGLTLYFNARMFVPDMLSRQPVKQARGELEIRLASRNRPEMPFSYIIGDYSFAPFQPHYDVPMEKGREYIVYYAGSSRMFLSVEPVDYVGQE